MAKITSKRTFEMGISVGKNLLQIEHWNEQDKYGKVVKSENRVYLKNGQQFQIFLKNLRGIPVMVELTINGETQEESIILDPMERLFLERYMSSNNKFKFNTYELSAGLKKLIDSKVELGVIQVKFYSLQSIYDKSSDGKLTLPNISHMVDLNQANGMFNPQSITYTNTNDVFGISGSCASYINNSSTNVSVTPVVRKLYSQIDNTQQVMEEATTIHEETSAKAEIGAIEKGAYSDQKFDGCPDYKRGSLLDTYIIHVYPVSAQVLEEKKSSKIEGAVYCSVCGRKQKQGQKFCPADGTEFGK